MNFNGNPLAEKSYDFALKIVFLHKKLISNPKEFVFVKSAAALWNFNRSCCFRSQWCNLEKGLFSKNLNCA